MAEALILPEGVAGAFGVPREATSLGGTELRTYKAGDVVLRRADGDARSHDCAVWLAETLSVLDEDGFRVERPIRARDGRWVVDGWTAWSWLAGRPATLADAPTVAAAAEALHRALARARWPADLVGAPRLAERVAWFGEPVDRDLDRRIGTRLARLTALRRPVDHLPTQVVHGDLNYNNVLIAPGAAPGIIDMVGGPYVRPPEFAIAVAAYWLGPYQRDLSVLDHFRHVRALDQMLIRVALRQMLYLVQYEVAEYDDEFLNAADDVCQFAERRQTSRL